MVKKSQCGYSLVTNPAMWRFRIESLSDAIGPKISGVREWEVEQRLQALPEDEREEVRDKIAVMEEEEGGKIKILKVLKMHDALILRINITRQDTAGVETRVLEDFLQQAQQSCEKPWLCIMHSESLFCRPPFFPLGQFFRIHSRDFLFHTNHHSPVCASTFII